MQFTFRTVRFSPFILMRLIFKQDTKTCLLIMNELYLDAQLLEKHPLDKKQNKTKQTVEINRRIPVEGITNFLHDFKLDAKTWVHLNFALSAPEFPD